jgi:hypothetical protein
MRCCGATITTLLLLLGGCASDDPVAVIPSEPLPDPVLAPSTPQDATVTSLVLLSTTNLQDVDGSGIASQLPFSAYLYAHPYPSPKWQAGGFELTLYPASALQGRGDPASPPLATWSWDREQTLAARSENLVGPFYTFMINLNERSIPFDGVPGYQFLVRFIPAGGGEPVQSAVKTVWCE